MTSEHDHLLLTSSAHNDPDRERTIVRALLAHGVAGIIAVPAQSDHTWLTGSREPAVPIVLVDRPIIGATVDTVLADNRGGVRSAVEHLVARGHRRLGFFGDEERLWTARERRDAFLATIDELGTPTEGLVGMGPYPPGRIRTLLQDWQSGRDPVTALVTGDGPVTVAVLRALAATGSHLAVVGFDDIELADLLDPPLTVVAQDPRSMGRTAAELLFRRIHTQRAPVQTSLVRPRLVVRASSASLASSASPDRSPPELAPHEKG